MTAIKEGAPMGETREQQMAEIMSDPDETPLEKLRFFCSLTMNGQDWLDVEPFFAALEAAVPQVEAGGWDARSILDAEGYQDWTVRAIDSGGGLCVHSSKELWIDRSHADSLPWLLHELAHIKHPDHTSLWADHFTALLDKYSPAPEPHAKEK